MGKTGRVSVQALAPLWERRARARVHQKHGAGVHCCKGDSACRVHVCMCLRARMCACAHACVRAHFCACVRACLRVCVRVYAHLNMCTKFTKHSGQRARIYVQLIACKCAGTKGCGFTLQRMIGYIQQLYPVGITAEHWGPSERL